jgi:predicted DNA-binding protein (UPF0251 family)
VKIGEKDRRYVNYLTLLNRHPMASLLCEHNDAEGVMQLHEVRYFLALCQERSFTRAARRCGVSQPSLTSAVHRLEQDLGGALFERKPAVALTMLGRAVHPYLQRLAENADLARDTAQALVKVADHGVAPVEQLATSETASVDP